MGSEDWQDPQEKSASRGRGSLKSLKKQFPSIKKIPLPQFSDEKNSFKYLPLSPSPLPSSGECLAIIQANCRCATGILNKKLYLGPQVPAMIKSFTIRKCDGVDLRKKRILNHKNGEIKNNFKLAEKDPWMLIKYDYDCFESFGKKVAFYC